MKEKNSTDFNFIEKLISKIPKRNRFIFMIISYFLVTIVSYLIITSHIKSPFLGSYVMVIGSIIILLFAFFDYNIRRKEILKKHLDTLDKIKKNNDKMLEYLKN